MEKIYKVSILSKRLILLFALLCIPLSYAQAQTTVTGTVISGSDQLGIPGVSVMVKGTTNSTSTDVDGSFTISAPQNSVLVFSSIGFTTQEVVVTQSTVNVTLAEGSKILDEVVVIGYGTQRKEAVTGSVASIKGDALREMPTANITQALQGRVAGVEITQTSSRPGAALQIRVRGTRSLTGENNPLIVLDGIPFGGSLADINPGDIKSLDILKDASATAIYGSRGSNGVILITTNKGVMGQEAKVTYNGYTGVRTVFSRVPMMSGSEFAQLRADAGVIGVQFQNTIDESNDVNTDWQKLILKDAGMITSHDIGIAGGTPKGSYNFSTGYFKDESVIPLQDYERFSLRGSFDQNVGAFHFGINTTNNYAITNNGVGAMYNALSLSPIINPYNEDGTLKDLVQQQTSGTLWTPTRERYEAAGDNFVSQNRAFSSYNSLFAEVKIPGVEGLKYRMNLGLNFRQSFDGNFTGKGTFNAVPQTVSTASIGNANTREWTAEHLLMYDRSFGKHTVSGVALYSAQQTEYNRSTASARDIPNDNFQFYSLGQANIIAIAPGEQAYNKRGLMSYMGRVMYSYDDRYMISAAVRSDGASVLAPGNQWHAYPAVSVGWNIKKEAFMDGATAIDQLKLRAGYGQASNQSIAPYAVLGSLGTRPYNFGSTNLFGLFVSESPNPDLGWEYTATYNYGLDFGFFKGRLTGTLEYYRQETTDVLMRLNLPPTGGTGSYQSNVAETENKGVEFSLNGIIIDNKGGFTWDAGFNVYGNRNKIVSLVSGRERDEGNQWFVGHAINSIFDYKYIGLWQEGDPHRDILEPGGNVGMIKVQYTGEYNADGTPVRAIGPADRQIMDINPKYQGGFNTHVTYKNFDFAAIGAFQHGGILVSTLYGGSGYLNTLNARSGNNVSVDYWTPENTDARYPRPGGIQAGDNPKYSSTLGYFDGSYVKIRTLTLGYSFTQDFIKEAGVDRLRLYCTVQNPFVIYSPYHKESGMDPEPNSYGDENVAVGGQRRIPIVGTNTPVTRNVIIGLNLTF